jgi:hypothetical protein
MPGIRGNRVFRTKEDALAVGEYMCDKIKTGQLPIITEQQMRDMHIFIPVDTTSAADSLRYVDSVKVAIAAAAKAKAKDTTKKAR